MHRPSDRDVTWRTPLQGQSLCRLKIDPTQVLSYLRILIRSISIHNTRQISTTNRGCTKTVHFQFKLSFLSDLKPPWCSFLTVSLYGTRIKEEEKKRSFVKAKFSYRFRLWHYEKRRKRKKKGGIVCQCVVFLPFLFGTMRKKRGFRQGAVFLQFLFVVLCEKNVCL